MMPQPTEPIDLLASGPFDRVEVHWNKTPLVLDPDVQAYIDARWDVYQQQATKSGQMLFDGPVAQLMDFRVRGNTLELFLQLSDYKRFVVTALRDHAWFAANAPQAVVGALGVSALLWHGDRCVLGVRSPKVSAYPGMAHIFGGVLEELGTPDRPANVDGLLAHLRQELAEELGLGAADLIGVPQVLMLARDHVLHQPELVWQWQLAGPIEAVLDRLDADEHSAPLIVDTHTPLDLVRPVLTPSTRLAIERWRAARIAGTVPPGKPGAI
jgi:hypothetical protein